MRAISSFNRCGNVCSWSPCAQRQHSCFPCLTPQCTQSPQGADITQSLQVTDITQSLQGTDITQSLQGTDITQLL